MSIIELEPGNFTSLTRTPWAGSMMVDFKKKLVSSCADLIGESWEFSCDPQMPSREKGSQKLIADILKNPCDILVKLLNANSPLSLQIHPEDSDPSLQDDECGKPEAWYILDAQPNSGIYLGFKDNVSDQEIGQLLRDPQNDTFLHFIPVKKGDYFEILPGVPHAIGPGVLLLEPQRVRNGKKGKTYRMWDWNRKYDANGKLDLQNGQGRELHVSQALACLKGKIAFGPELEQLCRKKPKTNTFAGGELLEYPDSDSFALKVFHLNSQVKLRVQIDQISVFTVLNGECTVNGKSYKTTETFAVESGELEFSGSIKSTISWVTTNAVSGTNYLNI